MWQLIPPAALTADALCIQQRWCLFACVVLVVLVSPLLSSGSLGHPLSHQCSLSDVHSVSCTMASSQYALYAIVYSWLAYGPVRDLLTLRTPAVLYTVDHAAILLRGQVFCKAEGFCAPFRNLVNVCTMCMVRHFSVLSLLCCFCYWCCCCCCRCLTLFSFIFYFFMSSWLTSAHLTRFPKLMCQATEDYFVRILSQTRPSMGEFLDGAWRCYATMVNMEPLSCGGCYLDHCIFWAIAITTCHRLFPPVMVSMLVIRFLWWLPGFSFESLPAFYFSQLGDSSE